MHPGRMSLRSGRARFRQTTYLPSISIRTEVCQNGGAPADSYIKILEKPQSPTRYESEVSAHSGEMRMLQRSASGSLSPDEYLTMQDQNFKERLFPGVPS